MSGKSSKVPAWRMVVGGVLVLAAVIGIIHRMTDSRELRPSAEMPWLWPLLYIALIVFVVIVVIGAGVRRGMSGHSESSADVRPGNFTIRGVDRATQADVVRQIKADSAGNAKAKAELSGMIVTSVERAVR